MIQLNGSLNILPHNNHVNKIIKTQNHSLNNSFSFDERSNELNSSNNNRNGSTSKLNLLKQNQMNRSNSVDIATNNRRITNLNNNTQQMKKSTDLTTHTLIELHKFLKDKQIYTNPSDNFKRRTIVLIRSSTKKALTPLNSTKHKHGTNNQEINYNGEFGFHLQTYGLVNSTTKQTEFICFVNNVQANSPAQQSGLSNGDVILAIDGICINEFKSLNEIMLHVRNKQELRLVIMCENICKKIQLKQRYTKLKQMINDKKLELERITKQEENILKKFQSPIEINHTNCFISPNKIENSTDIIKNSTPNDQMLSSTSSTSSNSSSSSSSLAVTPNGKKIPAIIAAVMAKSGHNISRSSPNGTARIQVETFTSPLAIPSTSSSVISFEETPSSSDASKHTSSSSFNKPELLFLKQTPRMSRSALSSSMSFLTKLNNNFKATPKLATQFTNPPMDRLEISDPELLLRAKANSLEINIDNQENFIDKDQDVKIKIVNYVSLSDSFTPALSSLSSSTTSSSLSSSSSISPNLSLTNSVIDKSFNSSNEIDRGVGCGIGTVTNQTDKSIDCNNNQHKFSNDNNVLKMPILKYASENYVITRL